MTRNFTNHLGNMHDIWDKISFNAYRFDSAPLLPPPQGEGDREAVEGVYLQWKDTPPVSCR